MISKLSSLVTVLWMTISCGCVSLTWSSHINSMLSVTNGMVLSGELNTELVESIGNSVQVAMDNCKNIFKWDRWNCPESAFSRKRQQPPTREKSITQAMLSAALVHTVTRNCSKGNLKGCGCDNSLYYFRNKEGGNTQHYQTKSGQKKRIDWSWGGCSDDVQFGQSVSKIILDEMERGNDPQAYVNLHNNQVGRMIVKSTMVRKCRCHGLSGSCSIQTCWMQVAPFTEIARVLRERYRKAVQINLENRSNRSPGIRSESSSIQEVGPNRLVYVQESPNYCFANVTAGWPGTSGRICSRPRSGAASKTEKLSCRNLCKKCGLRVRKTRRQVTWKCNCVFKWCCEVKCEICTKTVDEFFCD